MLNKKNNLNEIKVYLTTVINAVFLRIYTYLYFCPALWMRSYAWPGIP